MEICAPLCLRYTLGEIRTAASTGNARRAYCRAYGMKVKRAHRVVCQWLKLSPQHRHEKASLLVGVALPKSGPARGSSELGVRNTSLRVPRTPSFGLTIDRSWQTGAEAACEEIEQLHQRVEPPTSSHVPPSRTSIAARAPSSEG
ncbi:Rap1a/Tai family immunity protein [Methylobacterium oxalidis]|uniref:Rap1a/Tai family immunity protein n=1 Tax=Methylobacterium oxalidis TaxID=944322 RepID=UPI0035A260D1